MLNNAATIENIAAFRERGLLQPIPMGGGIDAMYRQNLNIVPGNTTARSYWVSYKPEIASICNNFSVIEFITAEFAVPPKKLILVETIPINTIVKYKHPLHPKVIFELVQPTGLNTGLNTGVDIEVATRHPLQKKISARSPCFWGAHDNRSWCKFIPLVCLLMDKRIPNFEIIWNSLNTVNRSKLLDNLSIDLQNAVDGPVMWAVNPYFMDYYFRCLEAAVKLPIIADRLKSFGSLNDKIAKLTKDITILRNKQNELIIQNEVNTSFEEIGDVDIDEDNGVDEEDEEPQF